MISYLLEVTLCWLLFFAVYRLFLCRETFFNINRWYLLFTLFLGLLIPLFEFEQDPIPAVIYIAEGMGELEYVIDNSIEEAQATDSSWLMVALIIYWIGVFIAFIRFSIGLKQILSLYKNGTVYKKAHYKLVLTEKPHLPFSFFNYLFWHKDLALEDTDSGKIITHELAHINQWHSLDVLFLEFLAIFLWFSPPIYLYKKALRIVHEYLADAYVLKDTQTKQYGQLLIRQAQSGMQIALANNFIHSQLKQRINMMTRDKSRRKALMRYLPALPLLLLMVLVFSNKNFQNNLNETVLKAGFEINENTTQKTLNNDPPVFSGGEKAMLEFIYKNIRYPAEARDQAIYGIAVVSFVVKKDGSLSRFRMKGVADKVLEKEVLRVVKLMKDLPEKWIPAKNGGKAVKMAYELPVQFNLEGDFEDGSHVRIAKSSYKPKAIVTGLYKSQKASTKKIYFDNSKVYLVTPNGDGMRDVFKLWDINNYPDNTLKIFNQYGELVYTTKDYKNDWNGAKESKKLPDGRYSFFLESKEKGQKGFIELRRDGAVFKVVEEMPRFPGCEALEGSAKEKKICADKTMLEFIYENIQYPKEAKDKNIQGTAVASFIVNKSGEIKDIKIKRSIGGGTDEEVLRILSKMPDWIPGKQKGRNVNVEFMIPIKFRLEGEKVTEKKPVPPPPLFPETEKIYKVVDQMPRFPGCEGMEGTDEEKKQCSDVKMINFVANNIKYPKVARENGVEGTVVVRFMVAKDGSITKPVVVRNIGANCGKAAEEVVRLMSQMPQKWTPGKQDGKAVNVYYNLPIKFKLPKEKVVTETSTENLNLQIDAKTTNELSVSAFPNPAKEQLTLSIKGEALPTQLNIFDVTGKQIHQEKLAQFNGVFQKTINLAKAAKGALIIRVKQGEKEVQHKVIVQ